MGKWFKFNRDHGIRDVAVDEFYNFAVMITPLQENGIAAYRRALLSNGGREDAWLS